MTKPEALAKLKAGESLSTAMLEPLGISFEAFLRFAQLSTEASARIIARYLEIEASK